MRSGSLPTGRPATCIDGKDVRGTSKQTAVGRQILVGIVGQDAGLVEGPVEKPRMPPENPAQRDLADSVWAALTDHR